MTWARCSSRWWHHNSSDSWMTLIAWISFNLISGLAMRQEETALVPLVDDLRRALDLDCSPVGSFQSLSNVRSHEPWHVSFFWPICLRWARQNLFALFPLLPLVQIPEGFAWPHGSGNMECYWSWQYARCCLQSTLGCCVRSSESWGYSATCMLMTCSSTSHYHLIQGKQWKRLAMFF